LRIEGCHFQKCQKNATSAIIAIVCNFLAVFDIKTAAFVPQSLLLGDILENVFSKGPILKKYKNFKGFL